VLDESVDALVGAYAELAPAPAATASEADGVQAQALQEANAELAAERDRLQEELRQANESMDAMAREYVSVYRGAGGSKLKGARAEDGAEGDSGAAASDDVEGSGAAATDPEASAPDVSGELNSDSADPVPAGESGTETGAPDALDEPKSGEPA
jgi:hypothetical protein